MSKREPPARPLRGTALATREALLVAASRAFNAVGYGGTDSNQIARDAGYSPGTFYRHFEDKRAVFMAVYFRDLRAEWDALEKSLEALPAQSLVLASALVEGALDHHRRWKTFRASLRALCGTDAEVRQAVATVRAQQLALIDRLRHRLGMRRGSPEESLLWLLTLERACDALADGEIEGSGVTRQRFLKRLLERAHAHLS